MQRETDFPDWKLNTAVGLALLTAVLAVAANNMIVDLDLFHEMALYRQYLSLGQMPLADDFAFTPTVERVVHHEWATGAVLYWTTVSSGWGAAGLVGLKYCLTFALCLTGYFLVRSQKVSLPLIAVAGAIALNLGGWMAFTNVRAQLFTLLFLSLLFLLIHLDRTGKKGWIFCWVPLAIVWSNMHGGVVSGIGVLGVYCVASLAEHYLKTNSIAKAMESNAHLLILVGITPVLLLLNPYGWEYIPYLFRAVRMDRPLITEWQPLWRGGTPAAILTFVISLGLAAFAIHKSGRRAIFESFVIGLTAYLAIKNLRHGSLYAVTWFCLVPPMLMKTELANYLDRVWKARASQLTAVALAISIVFLGFAIHAKFWALRVPAESVGEMKGAPVYPVGAVNFLGENGFQGNLFVPFAAGAYVSWKLYPDVRVSIDSRYEVAYPPGAVEENVAFYRAQNDWKSILDKYPSDAILIPNYNSLLQEMQTADRLDPEFNWRCVYRDNSFTMYFRNDLEPLFTMMDSTRQHPRVVFP